MLWTDHLAYRFLRRGMPLSSGDAEMNQGRLLSYAWAWRSILHPRMNARCQGIDRKLLTPHSCPALLGHKYPTARSAAGVSG